MSIERLILAAAEDRSLLRDATTQEAIREAIRLLDCGELRIASKDDSGSWVVHAWLKHAVLLYFAIAEMEVHEVGPLEFYDKVPPKKNFKSQGVRVVPPAVARYGSFLEPGVILMPSFVNIGARVGARTMVDTWATVGSCAQIGADVHLSGGVGIGGVLEPASAKPVIVEDGAFIGSRAILVEGVEVRTGAVIGAGVVLTASTPIYDVRGATAIEMRGFVPERAIVIPGTRPKEFPSGVCQIPCAYIIGERSASTDKKTSLNEALRTFDVPV